MRKLNVQNLTRRIGGIVVVSASLLAINLPISGRTHFQMKELKERAAPALGMKVKNATSFTALRPRKMDKARPIRPVNSRPSHLLTDPDDQAVRDSTYTPENNLGSPPNQFEMDSPNTAVVGRIRHRAGIANYSFGVPFASLAGRGIDASIGMIYNSRVWNKTGENPSANYQFNVDKNWLAPGFTLGYGKLTSHFSSKTILLTNNQYKTFNEVVPDGFSDPDGTRHQFECKASSVIPGTQPFGGPATYCTEYGTTDGTFIKVIYNGDRPLSAYQVDDMSAYASTYFTLIRTDGSKITYSVPGSQFAATEFAREHYPTVIQDSNGNQIQITYNAGKDSIDYIRDTLGRYIKFYYDTTAEKKLVAVTVPGFNGGAERQTIRFYYDENVSLNYLGKFSGSVTAPSTIRTLRYIYFPATGSGYRYDYHSSFGMITKITKLTGMSVSGNSLTGTGSVTVEGSAAATTEYACANDGSQTPLTDVPKYNQRTDDWQGRTSATAPITYYDDPEPATGADRVTTIMVPNTDFSVEYKTTSNNTIDWQNGLPKEESVTKIYGPAQQYRLLVAKTVYFWIQGTADPSGRKVPILNKLEITNDAGQTRALSFAYDGYNNPTIAREHDFAAPSVLGTELRRTETTYETGSGWINNQMLRLPKEIKTVVNNAAVSKVVYEYDNYQGNALVDAPSVIQHSPDYNLNSGTHQCNCHYECDEGDFPPHCPLVCDECPNQDPSTLYRGNITKTTAFSDATLTSDTNASVHSMSYDITGNVVQASMSCCNMKSIEYSAANQYAYPTKVTKGSSPTQRVTQAAYDFNTGLALNSTDENSQQTSYTYDTATLRQTRVDFSNGAWSSVEYNDTSFPYYVKSTSCLDATRSISGYSFFNGAGQGFRSRSLTANGYLSSDVEFDQLGRPLRSYNPYTVASLTDARPSGVKYTEVTQRDPLGRTLVTTLPDLTTVQASYSGLVTTMTDQAGKKRRQIADVLGRVGRIDEPDASGSLDTGSISSPIQPTYYEYDGNDNLTKVTQSDGNATQVREFQYDSLSRLRRERQVEATPTLDASGVHGSPSSIKWTGGYNYNTDGLLTDGTDARGVKTTLTYDGLNRVSTVSYTGETGFQTPAVTYTYDETETGTYNKGRLTKIQTDPNTTYDIPTTIQSYRYDQVGHVVKHDQTIGTQVYSLLYGYNIGGALTTETYPSGKIVTNTIDNFGGISTIADTDQTYLTGVSVNDKGLVSQLNLANGTNETFSYNDRLQLTNQSLQKLTNVLQKYDYSYGTVDLASGSVDATKNNGQLGKVEGTIGSNKQWSQRFGYDELGRLKESREYKGDDSSLTYKQVFDFDRFGNLYRKTANNGTTGQQNPLPYTAIEDSDISRTTNRFATGTTYDEAGQVTTDNKFRSMSFAYDANGRMIKGTKASTPDASTVYDGLGNRVAAKVNDVWQYTIYDVFGKLVAEYGAPPVAQSYDKVKYVLSDRQGSVRATVSQSGYVDERMDYTAFGEEIGAGVGLRVPIQGFAGITATRQGYGLTEKDDATGLNHTGFRKNENQAGRWTSPDPYTGSMNVGDPQSFNRYSYTQNEPTNFVDPSGLTWEICGNRDGEFQCWENGGAAGGGYSGADLGWGASSITISEYRQYAGHDNYNYYYFVSFDYNSAFGGYNGSGNGSGDCGESGIEIIAWGPVRDRLSTSVLGHNSAIIDGRSYSREAWGFKNQDPAVYIDERSKISGGTGYILDFGSKEINDKFKKAYTSAHDYSIVYNPSDTCATAFVHAMSAIVDDLRKANNPKLKSPVNWIFPQTPGGNEEYIQKNLKQYTRCTSPYKKTE